MAALTLRLVKGSPLTNAELDANFSNLNADVASRLLASSNLADLTNAGTARTNLGLGNVENKSSATIRSEITSSNVTTALGFTPYNATNPSGYITASALTPYLTSATASSTYQPLDADLTAIAELAGTTGVLRKTAANTWSLDTNTYLTTATAASTYQPLLGFTPLNRAADTMIGLLGLGNTSSPLAYADIRGNKAPTSGTTLDGFSSAFTASDVTTANATSFTSFIGPGTGVALTNLTHFAAAQRTFSGTASVQTGFEAAASLNSATTNYGFRGRIASGTGRWNLFMDGTAANHLAGPLGINTTFLNDYLLRVGGNMGGAATRGAVEVNSTAQSDVTSEARGIVSAVSTAAASFTVGQAAAFFASQGTVGAGSAITTQVGFLVGSGFTGGATNNYGFRGAIPSGAGRWNLFMDGTASNFLGGNLIVNAPLGFGAFGSPSYGTSGQFLRSSGSGAAPTWSSLSSSDVTGALGFTPYNSSNPNGYITSSISSTVSSSARIGMRVTTASNDAGFEIHKPGVVAYALMMTSENRITLSQTDGEGNWAQTLLAVDTGGNTTTAGSLIVNGDTTTAGTLTAWNLNVNGDTTTAGTLTALNLNVNGDFTATGGVSFFGGALVAGGLTVGGIARISVGVGLEALLLMGNPSLGERALFCDSNRIGFLSQAGSWAAWCEGDGTWALGGALRLGDANMPPPAGTAPCFAARAWVNFNGTGTVAIRASGNVSSITDNGVGDYTVNFTTEMPDANYSCIGSSGTTTAAATGRAFEAQTATTTSRRIKTFNSASGAGADYENNNVAIFR